MKPSTPFLLAVFLVLFICAPAMAAPAYMLDGWQNSSVNPVGVFGFLNATRTGTMSFWGAERPYTYYSIGAKAYDGVNPGGILVPFQAAYDSGTTARLFLQLDSDFFVSDAMSRTTAGTYGCGGTGCTVYSWTTPALTGTDPAKMYWLENTVSTGGEATAARCGVWASKTPSLNSTHIRTICKNPGDVGTTISLRTTLGTTIGTLALAGYSNVSAFDLNPSLSYVIRFAFSGSFSGYIDAPLDFSQLGSMQLGVYQTSSGNITSNFVAGEQDDTLYIPWATSIRFNISAVNPYDAGVYDASSLTKTPPFQFSAGFSELSTLENSTPVVFSGLAVLLSSDRSYQLGQVFPVLANGSEEIASVNCPIAKALLSGVADNVYCSNFGINVGTHSWTQCSDNASITAYGATYSANGTDYTNFAQIASFSGQTISVIDAGTGENVPLTQNYPAFQLDGVEFSGSVGSMIPKQYIATISAPGWSPHTVLFSVTYTIVDALPAPPPGEIVRDFRAVFSSRIRNESGTFSTGNFSIDVANATSCVTHAYNVTIANLSYQAQSCIISVPNRLQELNTTISYGNETFSWLNAYYGAYISDQLSSFGIAPNTPGGSYFLTWDADLARFFIELDSYTCQNPEVVKEYNNSNERCRVPGCPSTGVISQAGNVTVPPQAYTCTMAGMRKCFTSVSTGQAFAIVCGAACGVSAHICGTDACNSDLSACSNEPTSSQMADNSMTAAFSQQPIVKFFFVDNPAFMAGLIAAIILAGAVYYLGKNAAMTAIVFCSVALLSFLLTMPGIAVVIIILVAVFVTFAFVMFGIGGRSAPPGG